MLIPVDVATQKAGTAITLGLEPSAFALTPDGATAVFANQASHTVSIIDLAKRAVVATVAVGATPAAIAVDATGTTAWVACALDHTLVPVDLRAHKAGVPVAMGNTPGDLTLPAASGVAWVLFPSSNGRINFLNGTEGPPQRSIPVGNGPDALIGTGSETSWVANSLTNTVQRIDVAAQTAGRSIPVPRAPVELKMTADGRSLLVLGYGDGQHAGTLTAINTRTSAPSPPIAVGPAPGPIALSPTGGVAYVASYVGRSITVVDVAGWRAGNHPRAALRAHRPGDHAGRQPVVRRLRRLLGHRRHHPARQPAQGGDRGAQCPPARHAGTGRVAAGGG